MRGNLIVVFFLLLGMPGSWLFGHWVEGAPSPLACVLWFYGSGVVLVLFFGLLLRLHALAVALVEPDGAEGRGSSGSVWQLLSIGVPLVMGGGLLCKEFGSPEALGWGIKGVLGIAALLLLAFLCLLALVFLQRRCR